MSKKAVPDELTTDDVMSLFGWSRSEVSRRRRSGDLPEPDPWRGSPRKPRWSRSAIMETLASLGRLDGVVLAAFEGTMSSPVRWYGSSIEFAHLPELALPQETERSQHLYRVVRYRRRDSGIPFADSPEYQLSLCIAIDDPNPFTVFNSLMVRSEVAHALGYGTGEAGTIAVVLPADRTRPQLRFARIPADFPADHVIELEEVPADQIPVAAHLIGHPIPAWTIDEITKNQAAQWNPDKPDPVYLPTPRTLSDAATFRDHCEILIDRISRGVIDAPAAIADGLAVLASQAWEPALRNMREQHRELPEGWAWMFRLPDRGEQVIGDMYPALRWLATSPEAFPGTAEFATRYFGYDASIAIAVVDLNKVGPPTRTAIEHSLRAVAEPETSWLQIALNQELRSRNVDALLGTCTYWEWIGDPDAQQHPVVQVDDFLVLHVPRGRLPIDTPAYVEVVENPSSNGKPAYSGFIVDVDGRATPIPIRPDSLESVGCGLTAAVWAPELELLPGLPLIGHIPDNIANLTSILDTGEPLHLTWTELKAATGPGPGPHADRYEVYGWRQGDPPVSPKSAPPEGES